MTTPTPDPLVEQIARALDPWIWTDEDDDPNADRRLARRHNRLDERPASLERARAVLPLVTAAVREGQTEALRGAADMIEDMRNSAEVAEVAAYVPGEVGRQNVIDSFEVVMEEPGDWLRSLADSGAADTYREGNVNDALAEAWDEGYETAARYHELDTEHAEPNPYRGDTDEH